MNDGHSDMLEATLLTRAGRLTEATALLQRVLRGRTARDTTSDSIWKAANAPPGRVPHIIDLVAKTIEVANPRPSSRTGQAFGTADVSLRPAGRVDGTARPQIPGALRSFRDRVAFRPCLRSPQRFAICDWRHAARRGRSRTPIRRRIGRWRVPADRPDNRVPWGSGQDGAPAKRRSDHRAVEGEHARGPADQGAARTGTRRACLPPYHPR